MLRSCFRDPIPEIQEAADYLNEAVSAHLAGNPALAEALIKQSDIPAIREWTDSIWGAASPYVVKALSRSADIAPVRLAVRMPNSQEKRALHLRDGYRCRFCGIPVIRREVRIAIGKIYPAAYWGNKNVLQHAAFQAMWTQYDHILPHSRGGSNDPNNLLITCAPCNFGRMECTLAEVGLADPREREPIKSSWDGLERFMHAPANGGE